MSASTDYPWPTNNPQQAIKQWGVMCREIDRLRANAARGEGSARSDEPGLTCECGHSEAEHHSQVCWACDSWGCTACVARSETAEAVRPGCSYCLTEQQEGRPGCRLHFASRSTNTEKPEER